MCYENMEDIFNTGKEIDPLTHRLAEEVMKQDSQNLEGIFDKWGWEDMQREAQHNQDHPAQGIGKASTIYASMMAPGWFGAATGSPAAYEAAIPAVGAEQAAALAAQTGEFGAYGLGQTMQAGGANTAGGLLSKLAGGGAGGTSAQKMGMQLMTNNMGQQPPQQRPQAMPARSGNAEPLPQPYGQRAGPYGTAQGNSIGLLDSEEERKKKLRALGYRV